MKLVGRPHGVARADMVLAGIATCAGILESSFASSTAPPLAVASLTVVVTASLAFRRRAPVATLATMVASILALLALGWDGTLSVFIPTLIASATVGADVDFPRAWAGPLLTVGVFIPASLVGLGGDSAEDFGYVSVLYGGAWAFGRVLHSRERHLTEAIGRADAAETQRAAREAEALELERARIARELHDIVSHSISVIGLQSQSVRYRLGPDQVAEAADLRGIETVARQAMAEMRRLLGVLRPNGAAADLEPQPGLDQLDRLVAGAQIPVELDVQGPHVALPPGVDLTAYRIVQESLTNIRRHAPDERATVSIVYGERQIDLAVVNTGLAGVAARSRRDDGGYGLKGLRERALLYGGTFDAGPTPDGGFAVSARLPFRESAL